MKLLSLIIPILMHTSLIYGHPPVKAMTFNIRYGTANDGENSWEYRKELVFDVFKNYDCDFIGAQEAMMFQVREIIENVPQYAFIGRTRQVDPEEGEASPLFFLKDRWEILESGTLWLSETPEVAASKSWNSSLPRIFTWGKFKNRQTGSIILVYNTHYDHRSAEAREHSSDVILEHMKKHAAEIPIILTGDLNAREESPPVTTFINDPDLVLIDPYRQIHPQRTNADGTFHGWSKEPTHRRIDYVFNTQNFSVKKAEVINYNANGRYPSDHKPVYVELLLK